MWDARDTREYWEARVRPYLGTEAELASVTGTGLPSAFAHYTDWLDHRTLQRALRYLPVRGLLLEVGCGYGRWFNFWESRGQPFIGLDVCFSLVKRARVRRPQALCVVADVRHLPFRSGIFHGVFSVKVLQCLPPEDRIQALTELLRVLSPAGSGVLLEKIRDQDGSLPADWIRWATASGGELIAWTGNEYAPLDRAVEALRRAFFRWFGGRQAVSTAAQTRASSGLMRQHWPALYRLYLGVRKIVIGISRVLEPLTEKILPADWAVHGLFVFRKM